MVPHFFDGGGAGVFGNATGGRIGAIVGSFINGLLITFLPAALMTVMGSFGLANSTFGDADFCWFGTITGNMAHLGPVGGAICLLIFAAVLFAARGSGRSRSSTPAGLRVPSTPSTSSR